MESPVSARSRWTGRCELRAPCRRDPSRWRLRAREDFLTCAWVSVHRLRSQLVVLTLTSAYVALCAFDRDHKPCKPSLKSAKQTVRSFRSIRCQRSFAVLRHQPQPRFLSHFRPLWLLYKLLLSHVIVILTFNDFDLELRRVRLLLVQFVAFALLSS